MLTKVSIISAILLVLTLAGTARELINTKAEVVLLKATNEQLVAEAARVDLEARELSSKLAISSKALRQKELFLLSMAGREATLLAKPKLVEKLIQKAVAEREARLECITGGLCEEQ